VDYGGRGQRTVRQSGSSRSASAHPTFFFPSLLFFLLLPLLPLLPPTPSSPPTSPLHPLFFFVSRRISPFHTQQTFFFGPKCILSKHGSYISGTIVLGTLLRCPVGRQPIVDRRRHHRRARKEQEGRHSLDPAEQPHVRVTMDRCSDESGLLHVVVHHWYN